MREKERKERKRDRERERVCVSVFERVRASLVGRSKLCVYVCVDF